MGKMLIKLRMLFAEFKIYVNRTQTYLAPFQLFMIFIIFMNTTIWNIDLVQSWFNSKINFIIMASFLFLIGVILLGYIDTRLKVFRVELGRYHNPKRNPTIAYYPVWTALLMNTLDKKTASKVEKSIKSVMKDTGTYETYLELKKQIENKKE